VPHSPEQLLSNTQFHFEGLDISAYEEKDRKEEREYLARIMGTLGRDGDSALLEGDVADALGHYAEGVDADAIFMTTHGRTGVNRMWSGSVADGTLLGSVASGVLKISALPMLVQRP
jgi:nucleotide-binding universal stress UspA family protein